MIYTRCVGVGRVGFSKWVILRDPNMYGNYKGPKDSMGVSEQLSRFHDEIFPTW